MDTPVPITQPLGPAYRVLNDRPKCTQWIRLRAMHRNSLTGTASKDGKSHSPNRFGGTAQTEEAEKSEARRQWNVTNNFRRSIAPISAMDPVIARAHRVCSNPSLDPGGQVRSVPARSHVDYALKTGRETGFAAFRRKSRKAMPRSPVPSSSSDGGSGVMPRPGAVICAGAPLTSEYQRE